MRIEEANRYSYISVRQPKQPAAHREQTGQNELPPGANAAAAPTPLQDTVVISVEDRQQLKKESIQKQQQDAKLEMDELKQQLESANAQAEAISESTKVQTKCMIIAMRIISGDEVPQEDHQYLAKNDPGLYGRAITLRIVRENPKHYKRISEDEIVEGHTNSAVDSSENGGGKLPDTGSISNLSISDPPSEQNIPTVQLDVKT